MQCGPPSPLHSGPPSPLHSGPPSPLQSRPPSPLHSLDEGCTDEDHVNGLREAFTAWVQRLTQVVTPQHNAHDLPMCSGVAGGRAKAVDFLAYSKEAPKKCDSRLDFNHTYLFWGLKLCQVNSSNSSTSLSAAERVQHLVSKQPCCLDVDWNKEHGRWFWPIDQNWLPSITEKHGWTQSLHRIILTVLTNSHHADQKRLVSGACVNPQPAGRYVAANDWIGMWNKSRGICHTCPNHMWIGYDPRIEDKPPYSCRATLQRKQNHIIHLWSNCEDMLICLRCNASVHSAGRQVV